MRDKEKDAIQMAIKREEFLKCGFELFSEKNIDTVSMQNVADASGFGVATLYRYYTSKPIFVVAVAAWGWNKLINEALDRRNNTNFESKTGIQQLEFYLDGFINLYKNHNDFLRFNQMFNIYMRAEKLDSKDMEPYEGVINWIKSVFHDIYEKGQADKTIKAGVSEEEMFSFTLHLMLAVLTRYAVGLIYKPQDEFENKELEMLKNFILDGFRA